jgi:tRNA pseudouridine55 synthase
MPKVSAPSIPLSGLIAFHKPSGPTSNAVLDSLKHLFADSPLFAEPGGQPGVKPKGKGRGSAPSGVKMGQGGTLDPLADGILGASSCSPLRARP